MRPWSLERAAYRAIGYVILLVAWPLVLLGMAAEALTYIDPQFEEVC